MAMVTVHKPRVFLKNATLTMGKARETPRMSSRSQRKTTSCCMLLKWIGWMDVINFGTNVFWDKLLTTPN